MSKNLFFCFLFAIFSIFPSTALVCGTILVLHNHPFWAVALFLLALGTFPRWKKSAA